MGDREQEVGNKSVHVDQILSPAHVYSVAKRDVGFYNLNSFPVITQL